MSTINSSDSEFQIEYTKTGFLVGFPCPRYVDRVEITIWTIRSFSALKLHQQSLAEQNIVEDWDVVPMSKQGEAKMDNAISPQNYSFNTLKHGYLGPFECTFGPFNAKVGPLTGQPHQSGDCSYSDDWPVRNRYNIELFCEHFVLLLCFLGIANFHRTESDSFFSLKTLRINYSRP